MLEVMTHEVIKNARKVFIDIYHAILKEEEQSRVKIIQNNYHKMCKILNIFIASNFQSACGDYVKKVYG